MWRKPSRQREHARTVSPTLEELPPCAIPRASLLRKARRMRARSALRVDATSEPRQREPG